LRRQITRQTVHGTVNNGTTGKPGAGVEVVLIQLQGGMQPVAIPRPMRLENFTFDNPNIGGQPMLIRAVYKGVNFHKPLPPERIRSVWKCLNQPGIAKTISVPSHVVIFQPNGASLIVGEEYGVKNDSKPPQAFFKLDGNFDAALPDNAQLKQIAASGPSGMPVVPSANRERKKQVCRFLLRSGQERAKCGFRMNCRIQITKIAV